MNKPKRDAIGKETTIWNRIIRYLVRLVIALPFLILIALISLAIINPPFSLQMARSYISYGNINQEWIDRENLPKDFELAFIAVEDELFCKHWGFGLKSSRDNDGEKPSTLTQKAVRSLFLGDTEWALRRVLETPLALIAEIFWSKRRILELYLNHVKVGTSIFGVASASQTIFGKRVETLTLEEVTLLAVMLENPNDIDPGNVPPEVMITVTWFLDRIEALKIGGFGDCL